jgi:hypothetical protein
MGLTHCKQPTQAIFIASIQMYYERGHICYLVNERKIEKEGNSKEVQVLPFTGVVNLAVLF